MGRASFNIFNELNESFNEEVKKMQTPRKSLKERQAARKRKLIKEEAKIRGQKRYASLKENDWTVTYIPDKTKKDQTATISVSAVNKSDAVNKARQTIGQDCPITLVQPLQEAEKINIIPRNWKKITYKSKIQTNMDEIGDTIEVEKDKLNRLIAKNLRTGKTAQTFLDMLRNPDLVEIIDIEKNLKEADKIEIDKDGNKSIRDEKTGHLKRIQVSKKTQDKMADKYNKKLDQKEKLNETGEWDDSDDELIAWKDKMQEDANQLALNIGGELKVVKGFDKYQGPYAVVNSPKHGDVIVWSGEEDGYYLVEVAHVGWLEGSIGDISEYLNQDEIPQEAIVNESEKFSGKELKDNNKMSYEDWLDYIDMIEKYPEWFKNKSELNRPLLDIVSDHQDELWNDYQEYLKEDDVIEIPVTDQEPDYIIEDVTELNVVGDGDVQAPDIEGLLTLVDESLRTTYGDKWGHIRILSSNKMNENACYALVDISTPEIIKEFESRGIEDAAVGKNLILENNNGKITFKVNSLNGSTKFSKVTENAEVTIKEWIETEYLHEAMIEKFEEENQKKEKELKDTVENYIANRPDLKMEIANIEMFIEMGKSIKDEGFNEMVQNRMYGLAAEIPNTIKVKVDKDNKAEMTFGSLDDVVKLLFGEKYVKEKEEAPEVKASESTLKESYQQFNIGEIEVVFNPDTFECLYSIPSAEVQDKKVNLSEVPTVETPYDTNTIIKDYVERNFGRIPSEEPEQKEEPQPTNSEKEKPEEAPNPVTDDTTGTDTDINPDLAEPEIEVEEAELPEEPAEEETSAIEQVPEEQPEEVPEEKKAETGSAVFVKIRPKQPAALEDVRERLLDGSTPQANYIVVDEKDLTDEEWDKLTENLTEPESYLIGLEALDRKNYSFNVIKLKNSNANYDILVDPLGYSYPRYLAIIDK